MRVVHISGSPGCGKSTAARQIAGWPRFRIVDLDRLLDPTDEQSLKGLHEQGSSPGVVEELWKSLITRRIVQLVEASADTDVTLVFVGILEHRLVPDVPMDFPVAGALKFFLDPCIERLLTQWYSRLAVLLKQQPDFAAEVANGSEVVMSSTDFIARSARERAWHLQQGYEPIQLQSLMYYLVDAVPQSSSYPSLEAERKLRVDDLAPPPMSE